MILSTLPDDLLFLIITYLPWKQDVTNLYLVSKKIKIRIDKEYLWKYRLSQDYIIDDTITSSINSKKVLKLIHKNRILADSIIIKKKDLKPYQNHFRMACPPQRERKSNYWKVKHKTNYSFKSPNYWKLVNTGINSYIKQADNYLFYFSIDGYLKNIDKGCYTLYWKMLIIDYFNGIQDLECILRLEGRLYYYRLFKEDQKKLAKQYEKLNIDKEWITLIIENICVKNNNSKIHISIDNISNNLIKYGYSFGTLQMVPHFLTQKKLTVTHVLGL
tara:strand:+ start:1817 stop:2638 length:822 start_codon:yes stop_codon:yes gene_type:complete